MWVLIVILMSSTNMPAVTTAEFTTKDRCEAAQTALKDFTDKQYKNQGVMDPVYIGNYTICVEK